MSRLRRRLPSTVVRALDLAGRSVLVTTKRRVVHHQYCGEPLDVVIADREGAEWYERDWPVLPEIELVRGRSLVAGATVFNVGAHQGVLALVLARIVGTSGTVVAVDPVHHNVKLINENARLNELNNIVAVEAAVAREVGTVRMSGFLTVQVGPTGREVQGTTVDELAARYGAPAMVLVDVEGYEFEVLGGAVETLRGEARPDWIVECHVGCGLEAAGGSVKQILSVFPPEAYEVLAAPDGPGGFTPLRSAADAPAGRFFIAALAR